MKNALFAAVLVALTGLLPLDVSAASGGKTAEGPYLALEPFVLNLQEGRRMRFMQVKAQVMSGNPKILEALTANMPAVRDAMIMLLAHQDVETMRSAEGREGVRQQALVTLQGLIGQFLTGDPTQADATVEAVYFTDFVIQ